MKWKEDYKLGDKLIDTQHEELFKRVAALNEIVVGKDAEQHKQECIDAILFLKDYAVNHFAAEEKFQESLNYRFLEFHKAIHSSFVGSVLEAEKNLIKTDFCLSAIKEFCGFLSMWLIYHVAGADQKIITDDALTVAEFAIAVSYEDCVLESLRDVLSTILDDSYDVYKTSEVEYFADSVIIEARYDETRVLRFTFSQHTALGLVRAITGLELTEVDELAQAALTQFAKTICNNTISQISNNPNVTKELAEMKGSLTEDTEHFINTAFGCITTSLITRAE